MIFIYGLKCPETGELRYIGKAKNVRTRLGVHYWAARKGKHQYVSRWIKGLLDRGLEPTVETLCEVPDGEDWAVYERQHIAAATAAGCRLTNGTLGGEGVVYRTAADEQAAKEARHAGLLKPGVQARKGASLAARWADPEYHARVSASMKLAQKGKKWPERSPEGEQRRLDAVKKFTADPETKKRLAKQMRDRMSDPEYRQRAADGQRAYWANPENREKNVRRWAEIMAARNLAKTKI